MLKHLEPGIRELVDGFIQAGRPCASKLTVEERRVGYLSTVDLAGAGPVMLEEFEETLDGITVKVFRPSADASLPVTVYFHGGCFVSGGFDTHAQQLRYLARQTNTLVICIRYRLAPEHPYPAAHDDVYRGVLAIQSQGRRLGADTTKMVFVGDSAGGHLALVTSLRLKNSHASLPLMQVLLYPMLDPKGQSQSYTDNGQDYIITAQMLLSGFQQYIPGCEAVDGHSELYPLERNDYAGLPPTHIVTAEFDPLRDEGETLYKRLLESGVSASCERYLGVIHGFHQLAAVSPSAVRCLDQVAACIRRSVAA
ncbi:alpha/beta hydrolase fold domain-containing protein [Vibrio sp. V38_P2S17PM301]|uniref:alpha/beta hydrolase fold domain-containing protein n=2 Tax=unclassified Vibrio TaxID=2614977 RepID=UPI001360E489|nr:alpha/beta hydrolase fold domain-containing protein [Vibrio sp. V38_P2S17PM301]